ncbi:MAG: 50S ribosomal protein L18 [Blastocatellia bacterium]
MAKRSRQDIRRAVHSRIRKKVAGSTARPRLAIFRSVNHIYAQIIDDEKGATLCSASSVEKSAGVGNGGNMDAAKQIGKLIAERAKEKGISQVVFDRGGYLYHGRVKALAEGAREGGLNF